MINALLLIVVIWLLWTLHQDLLDGQEEQRKIRHDISKLNDQLKKMSEKLSSSQHEEPVRQVNINKASKTALRTLPRIGAVIADRIIEGRPYESIDDLLKLEGFTPEVFAATREHLSLTDI